MFLATKPRSPILNKSHSLARGLIGAWLGYEGGGPTAKDLSGYGKLGTIGTSVVWSIGNYGRAYNFPAVAHGGISFGTQTLPIASGYTLATVLKADTSVSNVIRDIFDSDSSGARVFQYRQNGAVSVQLVRFLSGGGTDTISSAVTIKDGNWHLVVATFSTTMGSVIYVDGIASGSSAVTTTNVTGASLLQMGNGRNNRWHGDIAMQLLFDRGMTANEVRSLQADPFAAFRRRPLAPVLSIAGSTTVQLSWTDNSNDEDGFSVERSTTSATAGFSEIDIVAAGTTSYADTELTAGTYWYRVRAFRSSAYSDYSNVAEITVS